MSDNVGVLRHYLELALTRAGSPLNGDCRAELSSAVEAIEADLDRGRRAFDAVDELEKRVERLEKGRR